MLENGTETRFLRGSGPGLSFSQPAQLGAKMGALGPGTLTPDIFLCPHLNGIGILNEAI